ncbi:MAG: hypothetical protein ABWX94_00570 [Candidatus Saccharimonadales bacterium]
MPYIGKQIHYPRPDGSEAIVELLTERRAQILTGALLTVIDEGYRSQFSTGEAGNQMVPADVIAAKYSPSDKNIERYSDATRRHFSIGSQIAAVLGKSTLAIAAFAKVSPAEVAGDAPFQDGCYLNDVIARQHRTGDGSIALHAALTRTGQDYDKPLVLEGFVGSSVNAWYERLGLVAVPAIVTGDFSFTSEHTLPMVYYTTPSSAGLGDVVNALEVAYPNLAYSGTM